MPETEWWTVHENLVFLTRFMADSDNYDAGTIADVAEKPWKWQTEYAEARAYEAAVAAGEIEVEP
jgi:hypothetical protein